MVQASQERPGDDVPCRHDVVIRRGVRTLRDRLADSLVRSALIVVVDVLAEHPAQVLLAEQQNMVEALAPQTADQPLADRVHVRMKAEDDLGVSADGDVVEH